MSRPLIADVGMARFVTATEIPRLPPQREDRETTEGADEWTDRPNALT